VTDNPPIDIQWEAPAECPNASSVRASTERLLGKQLDSLPGPDVRARGTVQKSEGGNWELHVVLVVGERTEEDILVAKKCRALADAMALKVALAIDPLAVVDSVQSRPDETLAPTPPKTAAKAPAHALASTVAPHPHIGVRVVGGMGLGPLPSATPGAGLFGSLQFSAFRLELGGAAYWGGVARYPALENVGANLQVFVAAARGCATPGSGRWTFPICGGLELGVMRGKGFGVETTDRTSGVWGGVVIGPAVQFRMTARLALWVEADAVVTLLKPEFHMRNLGTLYSPPAGGSRASAGFEVNL
jgi:hypothetical protein